MRVLTRSGASAPILTNRKVSYLFQKHSSEIPGEGVRYESSSSARRAAPGRRRILGTAGGLRPDADRDRVRFVAEGGELYALKALSERLARREYRLLRALAELNVPAVEVVGIVVDRGPDLDAILVTRFLEYSTTYRALCSSPRVGQPTDRLLDALVELLVRLHLFGFFWGDCSLSNTLFRY